jgi:hypothetical protein
VIVLPSLAALQKLGLLVDVADDLKIILIR